MSQQVQMLKVMTVALFVLTFAIAAQTQSTFTLKVHTSRGRRGYDVNSTMVLGARDMLVIDPQFSLSEAHKLAAEILEIEEEPRSDLLDPPHPDHLFGLAVLKQAFPEHEDVALPRRSPRPRPGGPPARSSGCRLTATTFPARSRCARGAGDAGTHARRAGVPGDRRRAGADGPATASCRFLPQGRRHRRHRLRPCLLRRTARYCPGKLEEDHRPDRRAEAG